MSDILPAMFVTGIPLPKGSKIVTRIPANCPLCEQRISPATGVCRIGPMLEVANLRTLTRPAHALTHWCADVAEAARPLAELVGDGVAIELDMTLYVPRPRTVDRILPTTGACVGKLQHAVADALSGVVYASDAQVTDLIARKRYAGARGPGVELQARLVGGAQIRLPL